MEIDKIHFEWNEDLPIFASEAYLQQTGYRYGWIGGSTGGELMFIIPFTEQRRLIFNLIQFRCPLICLDAASKVEEEKEFMEGVITFLREHRYDCVLPSPCHTVFSTSTENIIFVPLRSYHLDLQNDEGQLWANIHKDQRKSINSAIKRQVTVSLGRENLPVAYDLIADTLRRGNLFVPSYQHLDNQLSKLGDHSEVFTAFNNGKPEGCIINFFSRYCSYGIYSGGKTPYPIWKAVQHFKSLGVKKFDFGGTRINPEKGSKYARMQRFKSEFGTSTTTFFLWKTYLTPLSKCLKMAKYLYGMDTIDQELKRRHPRIQSFPQGEDPQQRY